MYLELTNVEVVHMLARTCFVAWATNLLEGKNEEGIQCA